MVIIDTLLFKEELCPISHDSPNIDWFSRANLNEVPHVTGLTFNLESDTQKTKLCSISFTYQNFYAISF